MSHSAVSDPARPEVVLALSWTGVPEELPAAVRSARQQLAQELADLDRRAVEIEQARTALALRSRLLDQIASIQANSPARGDTRSALPPASVAASMPITHDSPRHVRRKNDAPNPPDDKLGSGSHVSPSSYLRPDQRARRKEQVLAVARSYAIKHGAEFSARDLIPHLEAAKVDIGVRGNYAATAVANIIFHCGDPRFVLARQGVFRYEDAPKATRASKGRP